MMPFISGAIAMASISAAMFFLRYWKETGDRLFGFFAFAFFVHAIQRIAIGIVGETNENAAVLYGIRLTAFVIILIAIIDKNRAKH